MAKNDFLDIVLESFNKEIIKKLVFSRPRDTEVSKASARLCAHRGRRILALEFSLPGNTVSQKNVTENRLEEELRELILHYNQANLITTLGDVEWKISKKGQEVLLGAEPLKRKLNGQKQSFESAIESLDNKKNYILSGAENFLIKLGISDKSGRVHDKKQGKFRQINRFLEHIEDVYSILPENDTIIIYDLCCGKSYLSFAVYYYLTEIKHRTVELLGIDLKRDVITWCDMLARELDFSGMRFITDNVTNTPSDIVPDMVISLHACDVATDVVIDRAISLGAKIILSTPCCHRYLNDKISASELSFVTDYPHLRNKLCEAITDAIRLKRLSKHGYKVSALELTDPENTPKNTLLRAVLSDGVNRSKEADEYEKILKFLLGSGNEDYLKEIK